MADHNDFEGRETGFNTSLGGIVSGFCSAMVDADSAAKDAHVARMLRLLEGDNVEFNTDVSLIDRENPLRTRMSVPRISVTDTNPLEVQDVQMEMNMTVSASDYLERNLSSKTSVSAEAKAGWGPVSFGVKLRADVSVSETHKRKSDYSATTKAVVRMAQGNTPEALMRIMDAMSDTVSTGLKMNRMLIERDVAEEDGTLEDQGS